MFVVITFFLGTGEQGQKEEKRSEKLGEEEEGLQGS